MTQTDNTNDDAQTENITLPQAGLTVRPVNINRDAVDEELNANGDAPLTDEEYEAINAEYQGAVRDVLLENDSDFLTPEGGYVHAGYGMEHPIDYLDVRDEVVEVWDEWNVEMYREQPTHIDEVTAQECSYAAKVVDSE